MRTSITFLFAILFITAIYARGNMRIQYGDYITRVSGTSGRVAIVCIGGSGNYNYNFNRLPAGWTSNSNIINIPRINTISGQSFNIDVQVRDARTG